MATAVAPQGVQAPPVSEMAVELRRIARRYGFNPKSSAVKNGIARDEFEVRLRSFIEKRLAYAPSRIIGLGFVKGELFQHSELRTVDRERPVALQKVNELAILLSLYLVFVGYRGFMQNSTLDEWKREVVWLLGEYGYLMHSEHVLFCPFLTKWEEHNTLWRALRDNDLGEVGDWPITALPVVPTSACDPCYVEHKASQR